VGEIRHDIRALVEVFLRGVLRLEGETNADVGQCVHFYIVDYEVMFRANEPEERNKDLAAKVCRALCRRRVIKEIVGRVGTATEAHLQMVFSAIEPPGFSSQDTHAN
jgi:hypothetical protein